MNALLLLLLLQAAPQDPPKDLHGDPLPAGALTRMGTSRWRHDSLTMSIRYTKDGSRMVTAGYDHTIGIWDTATGRELARYRGHKDAVSTVTFTPAEDRIISCGRDGTIRVWTIKDETSRVLFDAGPEFVESAAVSPDAAWVACCIEGKVKVIEVATGDIKHQFKAVDGSLTSSVFTPDGKKFIAGSADGRVAAWNPLTGDQLWNHQVSTAELRGLVASPDGRTLAVPLSKNSVALLATETGKTEFELAKGENLLSALAYSPDGKCLAVYDGSEITLWDLETRKTKWSSPAQPGGVWTLAFHPKGSTLAAGGTIIAIHAVGTGARVNPMEGHEEWIEQLKYLPGGTRLVSASRDGTVRVWEAATGKPIHRLEAGLRWGAVSCLTSDGKSLVTCGRDDKVRIWDLESGRISREFAYRMHNRCGGIASKENRLIISGVDTVGLDAGDGTVQISAKRLHTDRGTIDTTEALTLSANGRVFATGHYAKSLRVWNADTLDVIRVIEGHKGQPGMCGFSLALSADGALLAAADGDEKVVRLWETATGKEAAVFRGHSEPAHSVALSPDGQWLASGSLDGTARLWDLATGKELLRLADDGIWKWVGSVAFSPDGQRLATGLNGTILVWDLRPPGPRVIRPVDELWTELASPEADKAFRAMWALVDCGDAAIKSLPGKFDLKIDDPERIRRLIGDLASDEIEVREKASAALSAAAGPAESLMADALKGDLAPEARVRLQRILASLEVPLPRAPELIQRLRALQALERLGANEAIKAVAEKGPFQRLRKEAAAALKRLEPR